MREKGGETMSRVGVFHAPWPMRTARHSTLKNISENLIIPQLRN